MEEFIMREKTPDFFVDSELICIARENLIPELSSGAMPIDENIFAKEKEKLRKLLDACEYYSNK